MIERTADESGVFRGIVGILLLGVALGVGYNWLGLQGESGWGVSWIGKSRLDDLPTLGGSEGPQTGGGSQSSGGYGGMDDPMGIGSGSAGGLPEVPDLDRPIQMQLAAVKQFVDARAAVVIDAREPEEFAKGHIPGALSMPYDEISAEPDKLEQLTTDGKPIIVYCGGGTCELSMDLAFDLIFAGHSKVLVYMGGYPEWEAAGNPVATGGGA